MVYPEAQNPLITNAGKDVDIAYITYSYKDIVYLTGERASLETECAWVRLEEGLAEAVQAVFSAEQTDVPQDVIGEEESLERWSQLSL